MQEKLIHMVSAQKDLTVFTFSWDIYIYMRIKEYNF